MQVTCHPGLPCHASWSGRLPSAVYRASFVKTILHSKKQAAGIYRSFVLVTVPDLLLQGAKLNHIVQWLDSFALKQILQKQVPYSCYKCKCMRLHLNRMCTCSYLWYRKTKTVEGASVQKWKESLWWRYFDVLELVLIHFISQHVAFKTGLSRHCIAQHLVFFMVYAWAILTGRVD